MKDNTSLLYSFGLLVGDFVALLGAFAAAYILRVSLDHTPISANVYALTYVTILATLLPFFLIVFALLGLYSPRIQGQRFNELSRLALGCFIGTMAVISYSYLANVTIFPARLVTLYGFLLAFCFVLVFRTAARGIKRLLFRYNIGVARVVLVGSTRLTDALVAALANTAATGYRVIGIVGDSQAAPKHIRRYHTFEAAMEHLGDRLDMIVQTELYAAESKNDTILVYAQEHHLDYRFAPGNTKLFVGKIETELFHSVPMIAVHQTALIGWGRIVKRLTDLTLGVLALIITSPVMILTALAIKLTDRGPVFFRQTRLTRGNRKFNVYKFRSHYARYTGMSDEAAFASMGKPELARRYRESGDRLPNDPRVTPIGRFIRRHSIDELPQLFNVIKGDISLVGPRALVPRELALYTKRHAILSVKSGLTGLAQVSGRRDIGFDERRQLDLYYVQNWSFWGDIVILIRTVWVVLNNRGAQ